MSNSGKQSKLGAIMLGSCMLLGISTASIAETQLTVENDGLALTAIVSSSKDILSTSIRVVGPDGFVFEDRFEDSTLQWVPEGDLADGRYNWEVRTVTVTPGAPIIEISAPQAPAPNPTGQQSAGESIDTSADSEQPAIEIPIERYFEEADKRVHTESGSFEVRDGWMVVPSLDEEEQEQEAISRLEPARPGLLGSIASAIGDFLFPSAHAGTCTSTCIVESVIDSRVRLNADTNGNTGGTWSVDLEVGQADGQFRIGNGTTDPFKIEFSADEDSLYINNFGSIGFGTSTPAEDLHIVDGLPAIRFDDNTDAQIWDLRAEGNSGGLFYVNDVTAGTIPFAIEGGAPSDSIRIGSNGDVGIGTATPGAEVHIQRTGTSKIFMEDSGGTSWGIWNQNPFGFLIGPGSAASIAPVRFTIATDALPNSLTLAANGAGFGTTSPSAALHVRRTDGTAGVLVEETSAIDINPLFDMSHNGNTGFSFLNTRDGSEWQFRTGGASGSSTQFLISKVGTGTAELSLLQNGDLNVAGQLFTGSSRETKTDISQLDPEQLLQKLQALTLHEWAYKRSPDQRHIGPMAEDFHATFGLGAGPKNLAPTDLGGIALATIQHLANKNSQLEERVRMLERSLSATDLIVHN